MNNDDILELNRNIGIRLKAVRYIYNEGIRLTTEQFAHLLDISADKLHNYEAGRSSLPMHVLLELHNRGINPMFLVIGTGDIFANNNIGKALKRSIINKNIDYDAIVKELTSNIDDAKMKIKSDTIMMLKASAGKIE